MTELLAKIKIWIFKKSKNFSKILRYFQNYRTFFIDYHNSDKDTQVQTAFWFELGNHLFYTDSCSRWALFKASKKKLLPLPLIYEDEIITKWAWENFYTTVACLSQRLLMIRRLWWDSRLKTSQWRPKNGGRFQGKIKPMQYLILM